jgi:hypothetical protein
MLAAYNSRSCVTRGKDGTIHLSWGTLGVAMSQGEFIGLVRLITEAAECSLRCGQLARGSCGRVVKCSMGQISLSHGNLTLWFSPEEFQEFCHLIVKARQQLTDAKPLPTLGLPWVPPHGGAFDIN